MRYMSTRGGEKGLSFEEVLFAGYAGDGGLYMPETIPRLSNKDIKRLATFEYGDLVKEICGLFIDQEEISSAELAGIVNRAYELNFAENESVVPVVELEGGLNVGEAFHGPTLTFKDLAMCVLGQMFQHFLHRRDKHTTVVVGTSGDTGSSAIHAMRGLKSVDLVVLLPRGWCSKIQELQMTTVIEDNIHNFSVEGSSDELDVPIRQVFASPEFVSTHNLCSINSLNWARILVQICLYAHLYFRMCRLKKLDPGKDEVRIIVPTGACGSLTGGVLAKLMGLPLVLCAAVGANDVVHGVISRGEFLFPQGTSLEKTWACAMDILSPYNVERIIFLASRGANGADPERTKSLMEKYETEQKMQLPEDVWTTLKDLVQDSDSISNSDILNTIRKCSEMNRGYKICPHSAVGVKFFYDHPSSVASVVVATASAAKFPEALSQLSLSAPSSEALERLFNSPTKFERMDKGQDWRQMLVRKIEQISSMRAQIS